MSQHHAEHADHGTPQAWLRSRTGIIALAAVAILGVLVYAGHTAHLLALVPYLFLLACPLVHLFMHGGHRHRRYNQGSEEADRKRDPP